MSNLNSNISSITLFEQLLKFQIRDAKFWNPMSTAGVPLISSPSSAIAVSTASSFSY